MTYHPTILVDTGLLVALYDSADSHHDRVVEFFAGCTSRLVMSEGCVTEVMGLLASEWQMQNEFLSHMANQIYEFYSLYL